MKELETVYLLYGRKELITVPSIAIEEINIKGISSNLEYLKDEVLNETQICRCFYLKINKNYLNKADRKRVINYKDFMGVLSCYDDDTSDEIYVAQVWDFNKHNNTEINLLQQTFVEKNTIEILVCSCNIK